ncbi:MAG: 16S rRNA (cytosine(1402)-N(4))-methyltransferase RsmH [Planctomycetota bacterium]
MPELSCHVTVLPRETVDAVLSVRPQVVVDGTFGGGGHTAQLLAADADGWVETVIGLDRDPDVIAREEASPGATADPRVSLFVGSYEQAPEALKRSGFASADALVLDLGLSSDQLADRRRGFSFQHPESELDLRFDPENGRTAFEWLQSHSEKEIADAIYRYGEERFSRRIARQIAERNRKRNAVRTVGELVAICQSCVPRSKNHAIHPATRTFQALRVVVNDELGALERTLIYAADWIRPGGCLAAISFHSLEDRLVKHKLRDNEHWEVITRKPIRPSEEEVAANPRSRSAKLRVARRR